MCFFTGYGRMRSRTLTSLLATLADNERARGRTLQWHDCGCVAYYKPLTLARRYVSVPLLLSIQFPGLLAKTGERRELKGRFLPLVEHTGETWPVPLFNLL